MHKDEEWFLRSPCFVKPHFSEYCGAVKEMAKNHIALALGLASIRNVPWNQINQRADLVPMEKLFQNVPKWPEGFRVPGNAIVILFIADLLDDLPHYIWPEFPLADDELTRFLTLILRRYAPLPQTLTKAQMKRIKDYKLAEKKVKTRLRSWIWAKSAGNTLLNAINDYRYRPQWGGIRFG